MHDVFDGRQWKIVVAMLAGALLLAGAAFWGVFNRALVLRALDVGQGDAILIQTEEGKNILIDAGPDSRLVDELGKSMGFFDKTIDLFILTHPHRDHYGGILDAMQKYAVKTVMLTGAASSDSFYAEFLRQIRERKIPVVFPGSSQDWQIGSDVYLDILYPLPGQSFLGQKTDNANNTSIALRLMQLTPQGWQPLATLAGDAEWQEELEMVMSGQDLQGGVLKAGHHGSRTSTSGAWLQAVNPRQVVISAGKDNTFGHPHPETLEKIKSLETHITAADGTIALSHAFSPR